MKLNRNCATPYIYGSLLLTQACYFDFQALPCIVSTTPAWSFHNISRLRFLCMNTNVTMFTDIYRISFSTANKQQETIGMFLSQQVVSVGTMSIQANIMKSKRKVGLLNSNTKTILFRLDFRISLFCKKCFSSLQCLT